MDDGRGVVGPGYAPNPTNHGSWGAIRQLLNCATRAQHYYEATFVRNGKLARDNHEVSQRRQTAPLIDGQVYTKM